LQLSSHQAIFDKEKIANDNKDNRQQLVCKFPKYNLSNLGYADYLECFIGHLVLHIGTKGIGKGLIYFAKSNPV
jgi:hypothetical protein